MAKKGKNFAEYHIENTDKNFIEKYWSDKNNVSPYDVSSSSSTVKVWIKCTENKKHEDYEVRCSNFTKNNSRCPECKHKKVHKVDKKTSFESKFPELKKYWSKQNDVKMNEVAPSSNKFYKFECPICGEIFEKRISKIVNTKFIDKHMEEHEDKKIANEYNILNADLFNKIIDDKKVDDIHKYHLKTRYLHLFKYLRDNNKLTKKKDNYIASFTISDILEYTNIYASEKKYSTMMTFVNTLEYIFELLGYKVTFRSLKVKDLKVSDYEYLKKEELVNLCYELMNYQDKFILYAIFCGILGKNAEDLRCIKKNDLDFENNTIKLKDRIIRMDETLKRYAKGTFKQRNYAQFLDEDSKNSTNLYYDFNMESEYLIKTKPSTTNDNGTNAMPYSTLVRRFSILNKAINKMYVTDEVKLSINSVYYSGFMHQMKLAEEDGLKLTIENLRKLKDKLGYKIRPDNARIIYKQKYAKEE